MKKHYFISSLLFISLFIIISGCSNSSIATIQVNRDSEYVKTFEDLNIGKLYDFDFKLNEADKTRVTIWVEKYEDGEKVEEPLSSLSYGQSPNKVDEGHILFGLLNADNGVMSIFLSAPNVSKSPRIIESLYAPNTIETWEYAIGEEILDLVYDQTYILAVYRQTEGNSVRSGYDYQNELEFEEMLKENSVVCVLKIKLEER
nr:hypothetical protein [Lysinibacillus timonensis]